MMTEAKSYPMENTGKKNPVEKDTFENRMLRRQLRKDTVVEAILKRLDLVEKELSELKADTHTHALYAGTAVPITKDDAEGGSW